MKLFLSIVLHVLLFPVFSQTSEALHLKAVKELDKKNYREALNLSDQALLKGPLKVDYFLTKAECQFALKDYLGAESTYNSALIIGSEDARIYNNLGNLLLALQKMDEAVDAFSNQIKYAKNDTVRFSGYLNRGAAKAQKIDNKGAYEDLLMAHKFDSLDIGVLNNLGSVCFELGMEEQGFKYLQDIIKIDPGFIGAYINLGFCYQLKGYYEKSLVYFDMAEKINPNDPLLYSNRSYSKLKLGDLKGAMKDIEKSIKIYPANSYAYRNRGLIYVEMKDLEKACADFNEAKAKGFLNMYGDEVDLLIKKHCTK